MTSLSSVNARVCLTAAALCIHNSQILLVKHKKLGIWLAPGGHVETSELPHKAAQRECFEETGLTVITSPYTNLDSTYSEFVPNPVYSNLHWISQDNYQKRLASDKPNVPHSTDKWPRGCEQHLVLAYLVKPTGPIKLSRQLEETDGIGWFSLKEALKLDTTPDIKAEIEYIFSIL